MVAFGFVVATAAGGTPVSVEPLVRSLGPGLTLEVDPQIELLAGVQAWTTWTTDPGSDGYLGSTPSSYAQQLRLAFADHRADPAVVLAQKLQNDRGFTYDAPPAFVLASTGGLAFAPPEGGYSGYLADRAGGNQALKSWAAALGTLASQVRFDEFFASHRAYYEGLLDQASRGLDAEPLAVWLKAYYGSKEELAFHFVLAPALMPGGGYGTTVVRTEAGRKVTHVYQVIRDAQTVSGSQLAGLTLHEFGHSFVNPAIGDQIPLLARIGLGRLWDPVKETMKGMAYSTLETFLNELVLRATTIRGQRQVGLVSDAGAQGLLGVEAQRGFYPIEAVYRELAEYEAHRDRWPRFQDFGPELLRHLADQADTLVQASQPKLVAEFRADFEGSAPAPGVPFVLSVGATTSGDGSSSEVFYDPKDPAAGRACLTLRGHRETSTWSFVGVDLAPRRGTVVARFQVRGHGLKAEGAQYNNAYAGFLVEGQDGKRRFEVKPFQGSFDWQAQEIRLAVDPATRSLRFGFFLSITGELSFDEVSVAWE